MRWQNLSGRSIPDLRFSVETQKSPLGSSSRANTPLPSRINIQAGRRLNLLSNHTRAIVDLFRRAVGGLWVVSPASVAVVRTTLLNVRKQSHKSNHTQKSGYYRLSRKITLNPFDSGRRAPVFPPACLTPLSCDLHPSPASPSLSLRI